MAKLVFGLNQSLDGYVDYLEFAPGPSLFRHFYEQVRDLTGSVYGRRMYEVMRIWDEDRPEWGVEQRDVRERILVIAERLFREIGYQKTTVADIAKALQMSPANVYRFFDSKKSINAGVARRLMGEVEQASQAIATSRGSAAGRLRRLLTTVHEMNSARYVSDSKMHDVCAVAMEENWDVCKAHMEFITGLIGDVIASGVASGEFHVPDAGAAAMCTCTAMVRFFHPQLIAESANKPGPTLDQMIDFVIAGLGGPDLAPLN